MLLFFHPICVSARNADSASETFPFCEVLKEQWKQWKQWKQSTALCAATASPVKCEMHPVSSGAPVGATLCHCASVHCAPVPLCNCATVHCAPVGATVANGASDSSASSVHTVPWSRKGLAHFSFKICFFYFFNHTSKLKPLWMTGIGIIFALLTFDFHVSDKNRFLFSVDGVAGKMREGCWWPKSWTLRQVRTDFVFVGAPTKKIILSCVAIFRLSWVTVFRFGAKY